MKKICSKCKIEKDFSEFYKRKDTKDGLRQQCKSCHNEVNKIHYQNNCEKVKERVKIWKENNKEYNKIYYQENKEKVKELVKIYSRNKRNTDPIFKLKKNIRTLICNSFKRQEFSKSSRTFNILGCTHDEFENYLFSNAQERYPDFTPEDYLITGKYHIDHIKPLSLASTEQEVIQLCHYTNLQILTAEENMAKHDSYK